MHKIIITLLFSFYLMACASSPDQETGVLGNALSDTTTASVGGAPVGALMGESSNASETSE
ncbi:MAG: hypothetical protein WC748_07220 [Legionellales bacterium]|jgi:hypothetical protein